MEHYSGILVAFSPENYFFFRENKIEIKFFQEPIHPMQNEKRLGAINLKTRLVGPCLLVLEIWPLIAL